MTPQRSFVEIIDTHLSSGKAQLPVFNALAIKIQNEIAKEDPNVQLIEKLIINDAAVTSEVLKVSNSSFYKGLQQISTIRSAIVRLGVNEVSNIVALVTHKNQFRSKDPLLKGIMRNLWRHSVGCAIGSHWLANQIGMIGIKHESFFAGLLHDVGKLLILKVVGDLKKNNGKGSQITNALLTEAMDGLHEKYGASLMQHWNFPPRFCEVAHGHHAEEFDSKDLLLVMVRLADKACNKLGIGLGEASSLALMATPEAQALQLSEMDLANFEIFLEDTKVFDS